MKTLKEQQFERLRSVYQYLVEKGAVSSVADWASQLKKPRESVSRALNGAPQYITPKFLRHVADTFPEISRTWLLTGEGSMLMGDTGSEATQTELLQALCQELQSLRQEVADLRSQVAKLTAAQNDGSYSPQLITDNNNNL